MTPIVEKGKDALDGIMAALDGAFGALPEYALVGVMKTRLCVIAAAFKELEDENRRLNAAPDTAR